MALGTQEAVAAHVRAKTWQKCAFTCASFSAAHFVVGAKLGKWLDPYLEKVAVQTAQGQLLAVEIAIDHTPAGTTIQPAAFAELCATCGLWVLICNEVLPSLAIGNKRGANNDRCVVRADG